MDKEFKWIDNIEQGKSSLVGIIDASRWMEAEIAKRKRTQRIALIVLAVVFGAVAAYVAFRMLDPRSSRVDRDFAMMLGGALAVMVVLFGAIIIFGIRSSTSKPYARYKAALAKSYPGLDTSSEDAIKSYVWNYADDSDKLLPNLFQLLMREGEQRKIRGEIGDVYTPAERVLIDVWQTDNIAEILSDWVQHGDAVTDYLMRVVDSFRAIGADDEAYVWAKMMQLLTEMELCKRNHKDGDNVLAIENPAYGWLYVFTEDQKERLYELQERKKECRPKTEAKLRDYVLQHKDEFVFGASQKGLIV